MIITKEQSSEIFKKLKKVQKKIYFFKTNSSFLTAFNVLKENFNERIINKQNNINKPEKKRIFDNSTFPRKSFDINDENFPSDVTNKNSCKYIEEIKFETQSIEKPENMKEEKEGTLENEEKVTIELSEIEKNEI